jgi:peptidoglycan/xylan/chitin deacetylase (PgdA/CDA1 family)
MLGTVSQKIFMGPAQRRLVETGVPIFAYHRIAQPTKGTSDPFLYVSPGGFRKQLACLRQEGITSVSVNEVLAPDAAVISTGAPGKHVVISFDDGFSSVLENGLDILAAHKFRAIQFLISGYLGRHNDWDDVKGDVSERLMDEVQVREWLAAGHEIGSHSITHRNMRHLSRDEVREELSGSKKTLEDRFGREVKHFCYPYGSWNESVRDLAKEAGYQTACSLVFGVNTPQTPPFELRRIIPLTNSEMIRKVFHRVGRKLRRMFRRR